MTQTNAHRLVLDTAIAMAHEMYDTLMVDDVWYGVWKKRNPGAGAKALETRFVNKVLPQILPQARATLASMLNKPNITQVQKDQIYEALLADNILTHGRLRPINKPELN